MSPKDLKTEEIHGTRLHLSQWSLGFLSWNSSAAWSASSIFAWASAFKAVALLLNTGASRGCLSTTALVLNPVCCYGLDCVGTETSFRKPFFALFHLGHALGFDRLLFSFVERRVEELSVCKWVTLPQFPAEPKGLHWNIKYSLNSMYDFSL